MLLDLSKLIAALEGHTKALLAHAEALASGAVNAVEGAVAPKKRGRPAAGETNGVANAPSPEQIAGATSAAQAAASPVVATTPATTATPQTAASDPAPVVTLPTLQQVADAIINLANSANGGRDKAVAILAKYNVKKVPELKPENFVAVLADVKAASEPAAPATGSAGLF